ncbi:MAG: hypothetical protein CL943_03460 [Candidatus Diapherotrites archaeon]|uniref:Uncharacterized protein n=1 Tax=Candidatus Iainarchaeum sp. TaxID=3101447 RepID=A0A2D6M1M1_9ARCH|nr:hypothetical protein [Candidatus Diapherotrites archaeon]
MAARKKSTRQRASKTPKKNNRKSRQPAKPRAQNIGNALLAVDQLRGNSGEETFKIRISKIDSFIRDRELTKAEAVICRQRIKEQDTRFLADKLYEDISKRLVRTKRFELLSVFRSDVRKRLVRYKFLGKVNLSAALHAALERVSMSTDLETHGQMFTAGNQIIQRLFPDRKK